MTDLIHLTLAQAREGLANKSFSSLELTQAYQAQMSNIKHLNAYLLETSSLALDQAKASDARRAQGEAMGLMDGLPIGIKDLFCMKGVPTSSASRILEGFVPAYESTVTTKLQQAGAVMLGKLNQDEFAMGSTNMNSAYGPVISPWTVKDDPRQFVPGGSSGGSSAAVSAFAALAATGTDTGGSIRQPAAFTGLVGLKPTYGRCSRWGMVSFASSLDQAGPITRTVRDCAIVMEAMAGYDPQDSTSADVPVPCYEDFITGSLKGVRVGIPKEYRIDGLKPEIAALWNQGITWMLDAGAEITEITLPHTAYALPTYYILAPAEASSNLARYDGVRYGHRASADTLDDLYEKTRAEGFGPEVKRRILMGTYVLSAGFYDAYFVKAQKIRRLIAQDFDQAFEKIDVILTPTTPTPAFAFGEEPQDPVTMYMNDVLTVPVNLAGLPAVSVPGGLSAEGLPLGLQLIGRAFEEGPILNAAYVIEQAADFINHVKTLRTR